MGKAPPPRMTIQVGVDSKQCFFYTWTTSATGCVFCLDDVREKKVPPESTVRICWDNTPPIDSAFFMLASFVQPLLAEAGEIRAVFIQAFGFPQKFSAPLAVYTSLCSEKNMCYKTCRLNWNPWTLVALKTVFYPSWMLIRCKNPIVHRALRGEPPRFVAGRVCWFHVSLLVSLLSTVP